MVTKYRISKLSKFSFWHMPCSFYRKLTTTTGIGDQNLEKIAAQITTWVWVLIGIICIPTLANAMVEVTVPDAGIFWLLGPALVILGILGKKKK